MSASDYVTITAEGDWESDVDDDEGVLVTWFVGEGSSVESGDILCEIQVEKVAVDISAPTAGTLTEVLLQEDDEFAIGETIARIEPA